MVQLAPEVCRLIISFTHASSWPSIACVSKSFCESLAKARQERVFLQDAGREERKGINSCITRLEQLSLDFHMDAYHMRRLIGLYQQAVLAKMSNVVTKYVLIKCATNPAIEAFEYSATEGE